MRRLESKTGRIREWAVGGLLVSGLLVIGSVAARSNDRTKPETIDATAMGTSTQLGRVVGVTVIIYEYSTPADRQVLVQAFEKGQNQGLVNALTKMRAVGRISIIRLIPTPTGRKIRFITNRQLTFGEVWADTQSQAFNLTAGELDLNESDKSKSTGVLYPAAQLVIDKEGQLQIDLNQNPWKLVDLIDWQGTPSVN
jgi:hypothetical protein